MTDTERLNLIEKTIEEHGYCYLHNNKPLRLCGLHTFGNLRQSLDDLASRGSEAVQKVEEARERAEYERLKAKFGEKK